MRSRGSLGQGVSNGKLGILPIHLLLATYLGQKSKRIKSQPIAVKTLTTAYLLWILSLGGILGLHRYYLGRWISGTIWICTGGLLLIGAFADLLLLPGMVKEENMCRFLLEKTIGDSFTEIP